ncbi:MAG: efflux RND transporter periplasmic adaptor subunit [Steroidobacteraceae bacterium]
MKRLALPVVASLVWLGACSSATPPAADGGTEVTSVRTAVAQLGAGAPTLGLHGVVGNRDEVKLSFKVGGVIRSIDVDAGASVKQGQQLAAIEPTEINSQLDQAEALDAKAARDLERGERLYADQVMSLEQLQNLRTQRQVAGAQLAAARFNRSHALIVAPADGVILARVADAHELVPAGQPVLVYGSLNHPQVIRATLADRELPQVRIGDTASIQVEALPGVELAGRVREISGAADSATGLFPIEIELQQPNAALAAGMVATINIVNTRAAQKVRIPVGAVVNGDADRAWLFVVQDGVAHRREVQVAFIDASEVALASGVAAGDRVVSSGAAYLNDGQRVRVADGTTAR